MITLKTLADASAQDVFNQVALHLLSQGKRAVEGEEVCGDCVYHSPDGLRCAAGCLISDEEYDEAMEWNSWLYLVDDELVPQEHANLISELQNLHDMKHPDDWAGSLSSLAGELGLVVDRELNTAMQAYSEERNGDD